MRQYGMAVVLHVSAQSLLFIFSPSFFLSVKLAHVRSCRGRRKNGERHEWHRARSARQCRFLWANKPLTSTVSRFERMADGGCQPLMWSIGSITVVWRVAITSHQATVLISCTCNSCVGSISLRQPRRQSLDPSADDRIGLGRVPIGQCSSEPRGLNIHPTAV
ncbi:hypothetical protein V8F06_006482 [Rhypophila decipiens]